MSAINMIDSCTPTESICYIEIQHFVIQEWKDANSIVYISSLVFFSTLLMN